MIRKPFHLLSAFSLLLCLAAGTLWVRGGRAGDYFGWKRQRAEGRDWVHEEWSARSGAGRLELITFRKTSGGSGETPAKAQIRFGEEGWFWVDAADRKEADKAAADKAGVELKAAPKAATPAPAPVAAAQPPAKAFQLVDENTPAARTRGVVISHWLLTAAAAVLPARWLLLAALRRGRPADDGHRHSDRVPFLARLSGTYASIAILLAFALGLLWLKSWYVGDRVSWRDAARPQFVDFHSGKGELVFHFRRVDEKLVRTAPDLAGAPNGLHWRQDADAGVGYTAKTFCFEHDNQVTRDGASRALTVAAPYWFLVILALVPPTWWLRNQKFGPVDPISFGRPTRGKGKGSPGAAPVNQRPI